MKNSIHRVDKNFRMPDSRHSAVIGQLVLARRGGCWDNWIHAAKAPKD